MQRKKLISKTLTTAVMLALYIGGHNHPLFLHRSTLTKSPVRVTLMPLMVSVPMIPVPLLTLTNLLTVIWLS